MTKRGALASSRVMLFSRFTKRSGRGVTTGLGPSLECYIVVMLYSTETVMAYVVVLNIKIKHVAW